MSEPVKHDPRGLVRNDLDHLRRVFKPQAYSPKNTIDQIMYDEGKQVVIDYIERQMVAKRSE